MSLPVRGVRAERENVARIGKGILFLLKMSPEERRARLSVFNLFVRLISRGRIRPHVCRSYEDFRHYRGLDPARVRRFEVVWTP